MKKTNNSEFEKHVLMRLKKIIEDDNYACCFIGLKEYREMLIARINVLQFGLMKKKKIKIHWSCSNYCHKEHKTKLTAWLHGKLIYIKHLLRGITK